MSVTGRNQSEEILGSGPEDYPSTESPVSLNPILDELSGAASIIELAGTAARLAVEITGASAAVLSDENGPVAARPSNLYPGVIADLWSAPLNSGPEPRLSTRGDLHVATMPLNSARTLRLTVGWDRFTPERMKEVRAIASVLRSRVELIESHDREEALRRHGARSDGEEWKSEEEFRQLIESVPAIVYKADMGASGRWHFVSTQIQSILGYTPAEWTSNPESWFNSIHPDDRDHAMSFEDTRLIGLDSHPAAEYRMLHKSGRYIWIYERARLVSDAEGVPVWFGVMQDVTALKRAEEVVQQKVDQQLMVARLGEMAMKGEHPDRLIEIAVESLAEQQGVIQAAVWEQKGFKQLNLCHASAGSSFPSVVPYDTSAFPGDRVSHGESVSVLDWDNDDRVSNCRSLFSPKVRSSIIAPIGGPKGQFGILNIDSDEPNRFTEEDGHFLLATANVLANAIERNRADESLRHRLHHDPLTDLPNRQLFIERLKEAMQNANTTGQKIGVLFLDIDHFKLINDAIGHHAGDRMLREVSPRLSAGVRSGDTVARFGGDEFGIVLTSVNDEDDAREIADRLLDSVSEPVPFEGSMNFITASIGISIFDPGEDKSAEALVQEADAAMYQAKEMGRAQAQVFGQPMREKALHRLEVERDLRHGIEAGQLVAHYQPIVSLRTGRIFAFEALVRWQHPVKGLVPPLDFIPVAEESDLITQIDTWILDESLRQMSVWQKMLPGDRRIVMSVNTSSRQIRTVGLPGLISRLLAEHGVPPDRLALEITESVLVAGTSTVKAVLAEIHEMGVQLALDDFGTGFSSLSYLNEFPLDSIKIDRSFIEHLGNGDPKGSAIADAIIQIGKSLSLVVVAEAVSSEAQLQMVRDLGCHMAQGFLFARPVSAEAATRMLIEPSANFAP